MTYTKEDIDKATNSEFREAIDSVVYNSAGYKTGSDLCIDAYKINEVDTYSIIKNVINNLSNFYIYVSVETVSHYMKESEIDYLNQWQARIRKNYISKSTRKKAKRAELRGAQS